MCYYHDSEELIQILLKSVETYDTSFSDSYEKHKSLLFCVFLFHLLRV